MTHTHGTAAPAGNRGGHLHHITSEENPVTNTAHVGRSWNGHTIEDHCPCPQAPCGLVPADQAREDCQHHHWAVGKSLRQGHPAADCPGAPAVNSPAPLSPEREQEIREVATRAAESPFFLSDCEGSLEVWRESALTHVVRDESGEITMWSFPSSYRTTDQVIEIDLDTWDPGEDVTDDQRRQDIGDLVTARAALGVLLAELDRGRAERDELASDLAELTQARQHGAYTFCAQLIGHVTVAEFAKKISEKRGAIATARAAQTALAEVLRLVSAWCVEANENGGVDAGDLAWRLEQAGHQLPDEDETAAPAEGSTR